MNPQWLFDAREFWDPECSLCFNPRGVSYEAYCSCGRYATFPELRGELDSPGVCRHRKIRSLYLYIFRERSRALEAWARVEVLSGETVKGLIYDGSCESCRRQSGLCCHAENKVSFEELVEICVLEPLTPAEDRKTVCFEAAMRIHETSGGDPCR